MDILGTIKDIVSTNLEIPADSVTVDSTFESLGVDSLDMAELSCELEDRLDIELGDPEDITTVGELIAYIENL